jgi:hypothetical protein
MLSFYVSCAVIVIASGLWARASRHWPSNGVPQTLDLTPMARRKRK